MSEKLPPDNFILSAQFDEAGTFQNRYRISILIGFILSFGISILAIEQFSIVKNTNIVVSIIIFSICIIFYGYRNKLKYRISHSKGERLRKQDFIRVVMESDIDHEEDGYLYHSINEEVISKAREKFKESKDKNTDNPYITVQETFEGKIAESIQQNCNQTSINLLKYYRELKKTRMPILYFTTVLIGIIIFYLFINIQDEPLKIGRIFIAFISIYFSLDIFSYYESFKRESEELKRLDKAIGQIKWKPSLPELMFYFSEYNSILENKPIYPYRIYEENSERITSDWRERLIKEKKNREKKAANNVQNGK